MNIDDMTFGEIKKIAAMFGGSNEDVTTPHIGKYCIIRTYASGVHAGEVVSQSGRQIELKNARRLWKWHANEGISLSEVSAHGVDRSKSRICEAVEEITILDGLEIIPCSTAAELSIHDAPKATK